MTKKKCVKYEKEFKFHISSNPEDRGAQSPDSSDRIENKLSELCIYAGENESQDDIKGNKYLFFSRQIPALFHISVGGYSANIGPVYVRTVYIESSPGSDLPRELSDLLAEEGFKRK